MHGGSLFRFLALAGFIILVAVALWRAEVGRPFIVLGVALAWAIASAYEWLAWRKSQAGWSLFERGRLSGLVRPPQRAAAPPGPRVRRPPPERRVPHQAA